MTPCSTGRGLPPTLRPRPRRLRHPAAHPSRLLHLVPRPDRRPLGEVRCAVAGAGSDGPRSGAFVLR
ncbi:hypothetical protein KPATCC21470_7388 [Kitasatospora purpeofusca]